MKKHYFLSILLLAAINTHLFSQASQERLNKKFENKVKKIYKYSGYARDISIDFLETLGQCLSNGYSSDYCTKTASICATYNFTTQNIPGFPAEIMRELQLFEVYKPYCANLECFQCCFQNGKCNSSFIGWPVINCNLGYGPDSRIAGMTRVIDPNPQPGQGCIFTPQTCDHLPLCNTGLTPQQIININNDPDHIIKALLSVHNRSKTFASNSLEFGIYNLMNTFAQGEKIVDEAGNVIENEVIEDDLIDIIYGRGHEYWHSFIDTISKQKGDIQGFRVLDSLTNTVVLSPTKLNLNRQLFLCKYLSSVPNLYERMKFTESRIWTQSDKIAYIGDTSKVDSIFLSYMSPLTLSILKNKSNGLIDYRLLSVPLPGESIDQQLFNGYQVGIPPVINVNYNSNFEFEISITNMGTHNADSPISLSYVWGDGTSMEGKIMPNETKSIKHNYLYKGRYRVVIYAQNTSGLRSVFFKEVDVLTSSIPDQPPSFNKVSFSTFKVFAGPLSNVGNMYFDIIGVTMVREEFWVWARGNKKARMFGYLTT